MSTSLVTAIEFPNLHISSGACDFGGVQVGSFNYNADQVFPVVRSGCIWFENWVWDFGNTLNCIYSKNPSRDTATKRHRTCLERPDIPGRMCTFECN